MPVYGTMRAIHPFSDERRRFKMSPQRKNDSQIVRIAYVGMMAAIVFVGNYFRIPFMDTKLTLVNALCVISGLLLGPGGGFLSAGIGSLLYDIVMGYGLESLITFFSKGMIPVVTALVAGQSAKAERITVPDRTRIFLGAGLGAFTYVILYMLKTLVMGLTVKGLTLEATWISMGMKFPGSAINAIFAAIAGPLLFFALRPALFRAGLFSQTTRRPNPPF